MCKAAQEAQTREGNADDNEPRFLRVAKVHRAIALKEAAVQKNIARKRLAHKRSKKSIYGLYEVLAPGSRVQKTDHHSSVIRNRRD